MSLTPARLDLPAVDDAIAAMHGSLQWYFGPLRVLHVDLERRVVECRPILWRETSSMVFTPTEEDPHPLRWNLLSDLTDEEFDALKRKPDEGRLYLRAIDGARNAIDAMLRQPQLTTTTQE